MKLSKKVVAVFLTVAMLVGILAIAPATTNAATVDSAPVGAVSLQDLQNKFPNGAYWNHVTQSGHSYNGTWHVGSCNNPDGYTWSPCYSHNVNAPVGCTDCNEFEGCLQCMGFARKISYDAYGYSCASWGTKGIWDCKRGDIIHYYGSGADANWGHWVMVIGRDGATISVGEANAGGLCLISWGRTLNLNNISGTCYDAPWELPISSIPENIWMNVSRSSAPTGTALTFTFGANNANAFTIGINRDGNRVITENISSGKSYTFDTEGSYSAYVTAHGSGGSADSASVNFTVYNSKQGDDFYATIGALQGGYVVGVDASNNVQLQKPNDSDNQRWHFQRNNNGSYRITNVGTQLSLDLHGGTANSNENIWVCNSNDTDAQKWYLREEGAGFSFIPKCNLASAMDVSGSKFAAGTNIADYTYNGTSAQKFVINYIDLVPAVTQTFNGHKYELYNISASWRQAYRFCEQKGGHLATVTSKSENDFIRSMANNASLTNYIWLGGTDMANEGKWEWVTDEAFSYTNWNTNQPDNYGYCEHYLHMYEDGKWNDYTNSAGNSKTIFVCEYDNTVDVSQYTPAKTITYNNFKYEYYSKGATWFDAKEICEQKGGHLVVIDDAAENEAMKNLISGNSWIGITDVNHEGVWTDIYGYPLTYTPWDNDEPNNTIMIEQCANIYPNGKWNDHKGFYKLGFICEYNNASCQHNYTEAFVEAGVNGKQGYILHKCSKCGESYTTDYMNYSDGWYTPADGSKTLPKLISDDVHFTVQYNNQYEKVQATSPGAGWVNSGVVKDEWVPDGGTYDSYSPLSTSNERRLVKECYYHYCIPGAEMGSEGNYEQSGSFQHYDEIVLPNQWIVVKWTGDDNGHTVYVLSWGEGGSEVYCKSGEQCDGSWGYHDYRCRVWYKKYVYQNYRHVVQYRWTKSGGWSDKLDNSAASTNVRFKTTLFGDANLDTRINISDVTAIQRHIAESNILTGDAFKAADVNCDGAVNINDATLLQQYLAEFDVAIG